MSDKSTGVFLKGLGNSINEILAILAIKKKAEQLKIYNINYKDNTYLFNSFDPDNYTLHKDEEKFIHYFIREFNSKIKDTKYTKTIYDYYIYGLLRYFRIVYPLYISSDQAKIKNINRFSDTDIEHLKYRFEYFNKYQKHMFEFIDKLIEQTAWGVNEKKEPEFKIYKTKLNNKEFWGSKIDYHVYVDPRLHHYIGYDFRIFDHRELMVLAPVEFTL